MPSMLVCVVTGLCRVAPKASDCQARRHVLSIVSRQYVKEVHKGVNAKPYKESKATATLHETIRRRKIPDAQFEQSVRQENGEDKRGQ